MPLASHPTVSEHTFRPRGIEFSRVDGFSDVVFGFALTLLVVSLEVPKTYSELHEMMRGFLPFAISFVLLMTIWHAHYLFFRRFGLQDTVTITLNAALLFVVLFYVYPLKFLFRSVVDQAAGVDVQVSAYQGRELMVVYSLGFVAIYLLFAGLYWNGWKYRATLGLTPLEKSLTKIYIADHLATAAIGLMVCLLALVLPRQFAGMAGFAFLLLGLSKTFLGFHTGRLLRAGTRRTR